MQRAIVLGGAGGLGRTIVQTFRSRGWSVLSVDCCPHDWADHTVVFDQDQGPRDQARMVLDAAGGDKFNAVVSAAGGFSMGALDGDDVFETFDHMHKVNLLSALVASHVATKTLAPGGVAVLHGAIGALNGTPDLIGYGVSKAGTHHLIKSLAVRGLPDGARVIGVLPGTIDTPANRAAMPDADKASWTPPQHIADKILQWAGNEDQGTASGSFMQAVTEGGTTTWVRA